MAQKVFVSYSREDGEAVNKFLSMLPKDSFDIWVDYQSLKYGKGYTSEIFKAISESDIYLVFLSRQSQQSNWVNEEIEYALQESISNRHLKIAGVLLDDTSIPIGLRHKHLIDGNESIIVAADNFVRNFQYDNRQYVDRVQTTHEFVPVRKKSKMPIILAAVCVVAVLAVVAGIMIMSQKKNVAVTEAIFETDLEGESDKKGSVEDPDYQKEKIAEVMEKAELLAVKKDYEGALAVITVWESVYPDSEELKVKEQEYSEKAEKAAKVTAEAEKKAAKDEETEKVAEKPVAEIIFHITESSNLRSEPKHDSALITTVRDTSVNLHYFGENGEGYGSDGMLHTWYKVYLDDGKVSGWIRADLVY